MANMRRHKRISRIDQPHKKHHDWYVRVTWKGQNTAKFFSDVKCGDKEAAVEYA